MLGQRAEYVSAAPTGGWVRACGQGASVAPADSPRSTAADHRVSANMGTTRPNLANLVNQATFRTNSLR